MKPPQFDDGVYKISVVCETKPVTITCTDSDPAVLLATSWGAYPRAEVGFGNSGWSLTAYDVST